MSRRIYAVVQRQYEGTILARFDASFPEAAAAAQRKAAKLCETSGNPGRYVVIEMDDPDPARRHGRYADIERRRRHYEDERDRLETRAKRIRSREAAYDFVREASQRIRFMPAVREPAWLAAAQNAGAETMDALEYATAAANAAYRAFGSTE